MATITFDAGINNFVVPGVDILYMNDYVIWLYDIHTSEATRTSIGWSLTQFMDLQEDETSADKTVNYTKLMEAFNAELYNATYTSKRDIVAL